MKYERFEDLPVWQAAAALAAEMFDWTQHVHFRHKGDLANQLQRATLSISNNIAEGFERGSTNELLAFLYYARGSAGEVRSMLSVVERIGAFSVLASDIARIKSTCESISRQIRGWAASLQDSEIQGQRHLNQQTRSRYQRQQRQRAFIQTQQEFKAEHEARIQQQAQQRNSSG